jgi:hypothetical protein
VVLVVRWHSSMGLEKWVKLDHKALAPACLRGTLPAPEKASPKRTGCASWVGEAAGEEERECPEARRLVRWGSRAEAGCRSERSWEVAGWAWDKIWAGRAGLRRSRMTRDTVPAEARAYMDQADERTCTKDHSDKQGSSGRESNAQSQAAANWTDRQSHGRVWAVARRSCAAAVAAGERGRMGRHHQVEAACLGKSTRQVAAYRIRAAAVGLGHEHSR